MRIDSKVGVAVVADAREAKGTGAPTTKSTTESPAAVVKLSAAGTSASQTKDAEISPANAERLSSIRQAIKTGNYPIDLDKLASRIVDDDFMRGTGS
ncbi:MAG TPA: flagellar biosynthesis anti-sigma factor FlgM [Kofleriaceae bacterium]